MNIHIVGAAFVANLPLILGALFLGVMGGLTYRAGYKRAVLDTEIRWREAVGRECSHNCRRMR